MNITFRIPALRWAALALPGFLALAAHATPFSLLRDTVDMRASDNVPAFDILVHAGADTLVFDSLSVRLVTNMPYAELRFRLQSGTEPNYALNEEFYADNMYGNAPFRFRVATRFAVKAQTVRMVNPRFDACVYCLVKRSGAQGTVAIGDTIRAWVRFHSGNDKDSVLFLGKQRVSAALSPSGKLRPNFGALPQRPVDASGRALRAPARHTLNAPGK